VVNTTPFLLNKQRMNIFELTRILNEATKIANEISEDILNYDEQIETSNSTDTKEK